MKRGNLAEKSARCQPKTGPAGPSGLKPTRENEKITNPVLQIMPGLKISARAGSSPTGS
jgi:hypothetical protein